MPSIRVVEPSTSAGGDAPEAAAVKRALAHGKELGEDLLGWIDLRIQKEKIEVTEVLNQKVNLAADMALAGVLGGLGGFFLLVAAAIGIGTLLGNVGWGFLILGAVFTAAGGLFYLLKPTLKDLRRPGIVKQERLAPNAPQGRPHPEKDGAA